MDKTRILCLPSSGPVVKVFCINLLGLYPALLQITHNLLDMGTLVLGAVSHCISPQLAAFVLVAMVDFLFIVREYLYQAPKEACQFMNEFHYKLTKPVVLMVLDRKEPRFQLQCGVVYRLLFLGGLLVLGTCVWLQYRSHQSLTHGAGVRMCPPFSNIWTQRIRALFHFWNK